MGQQQLLLVILVTIIVGIATVVAINTFGTAADQANVDAVRQDMIQIAASAQQFYMRPEMLGGGGRSFVGITFNDFAFAAAGISENGLIAQNENGRYEISSSAASEFTLMGYPSSESDYTAGTITDGVLSGGNNPANDMEGVVRQDELDWVRSSPGEAETGGT